MPVGGRGLRGAARRVAAFAGLAALAAGLGACAPEPVDVGVIGVAFPAKTDRWTRAATVLEDRIERAGFGIEIRYAGDDVPTQIRQIESLAGDVDALLVAAVDTTALTNVLDGLPASIPIVAYDRLPGDTGAIDEFVSFDRVLAGRLAAWSVLDGLGLAALDGSPRADPPSGPFTLELVNGPPSDVVAEDLLTGALEVLQPLIDDGVLVVRSGQTDAAQIAAPDWDGDRARERMTGILAAYYPAGDLDAVLSLDDRLSAGVIAALGDATDGPVAYPVISGRGGRLDAARAILAGRQHATVFADTEALAEAGASVVLALLDDDPPPVTEGAERDNGAGPVPTLLVPPETVVADNLRRILVDGGYLTEEELAGDG